MKNKDLVAALQQLDPEMEVAIFDWRKNLISDLGTPCSAGIYQEIQVKLITDEEERPEIPEADRAAASWIALAFQNEEFEDEVERSCRVCGCTDFDCRQCIEKTGQPCHWVEPGLCSACVPRIITL